MPADELRLQRGRMHTICVEALRDGASTLHEVGNRVVIDDNVCRGDRLLLVEAPDMELVDRENSRDLDGCLVSVIEKVRDG